MALQMGKVLFHPEISGVMGPCVYTPAKCNIAEKRWLEDDPFLLTVKLFRVNSLLNFGGGILLQGRPRSKGVINGKPNQKTFRGRWGIPGSPGETCFAPLEP